MADDLTMHPLYAPVQESLAALLAGEIPNTLRKVLVPMPIDSAIVAAQRWMQDNGMAFGWDGAGYYVGPYGSAYIGGPTVDESKTGRYIFEAMRATLGGK